VGLATPETALALLARLRRGAGEAVESFELISDAAHDLVLQHLPGARRPLQGTHPWHALIELDAEAFLLEELLADAASAGEIADAVLAGSVAHGDALWALREAIPEAEKREGGAVKNDISVAVADLAAFHARAEALMATEFPGSRPFVFGHLGDGNLHWNIRPPLSEGRAWLAATGEAARKRLHDLIAEFGGSISAEHGIGTLKRAELGRLGNPARLAAMRAIKTALDPAGIMNPGKLLP
jgi:FAD/FMN-containing dehydrogenase